MTGNTPSMRCPSTRRQLLWGSLVVISFIGLMRLEFGTARPTGEAFTIVTKYHGINASEIERSITNILENVLADLPGIKEISSTSEFAQSRVVIILDGTVSSDDFYLLLRSRVDRAGARWPDSVQRPHIYSSSTKDSTVFIVAFTAAEDLLPTLRNNLEKIVKPRIERIEGVGEVGIGGGGIREIHVEVNPGQSSRIGISPIDIANFLQSQHLHIPVGKIEEGRGETTILFNGNLKRIDSMKSLTLNIKDSGPVPLGNVADVYVGHREPEDISRLNDRKTVTLYIKAAGKANVVRVSKRLRKELKKLEDEGYSQKTVYDMGVMLEKSIKDVLISVLIGMAAIALFLFLTLPSARAIAHLVFSLPLMGALTISILSVFGIPIDQAILAGLAVGIGMMIDGALVITDATHNAEYSLKTTAPPLIASTATTLIVFIPLLQSTAANPVVAKISLSIILLLTFSLSYNLVFLPHFLASPAKTRPLLPQIAHPPRRLIAWSVRHPFLVLGFSFLTMAGALVSSFNQTFQIDDIGEGNALFVHLEMESGASLSSVDSRMTAISRDFRAHHAGIISMESRARVGQGQLNIHFDPAKTSPSILSRGLRKSAATVRGVFAYVTEGAPHEESRIEFTLSGPG